MLINFFFDPNFVNTRRGVVHISILVPTYFPVQPARPKQCRVQHVWPVCGHDELDLAQPVKPVHLVQQLHQGPLDLSVSRCPLREPPPSNGVNLIHEDDTGLMVLSIGWGKRGERRKTEGEGGKRGRTQGKWLTEHLPDEPGTLSDILVHNSTGDHLQEVGIQLTGHSTSQECLSRPWEGRGEGERGKIGSMIINVRLIATSFIQFASLPHILYTTMTIPGGPYSRHPLGGLIPTLWNSSGFIRGSSIT